MRIKFRVKDESVIVNAWDPVIFSKRSNGHVNCLVVLLSWTSLVVAYLELVWKLRDEDGQ